MDDIALLENKPIQDKVQFLKHLVYKLIHQQFGEAITELKAQQPNWILLTLRYFHLEAVKQLRRILEEENLTDHEAEHTAITNWYNPEITLCISSPHMDWSQEQLTPELLKAFTTGESDKYRFKLSLEEQKQILSDLEAFLVFEMFHGGTSFVRKATSHPGETYTEENFTPIFLPFIKSIIDLWPNEKAQIIEELKKPFSLYKTYNLTEAGTNKPIEIAGMQFTMKTEQATFEGYLTADFHPLVLDIENQIAYHSITTKLIFASIPLANGKFYRPSPEHWTKELRNIFWENLIGELEKSFDKLQNSSLYTNEQAEIKEAYRKDLIPSEIPNYTFPELKEMVKAIHDGKNFINWNVVETADSLIYKRQGQTLAVHMPIRSSIKENSQSLRNLDDLKASVTGFKQETSDLLKLMVQLAIREQRARFDLDQLISSLGWQTRNSQEKQALRQKIWEWILSIDVMRITGSKARLHKDLFTGKQTKTFFTDTFIKIIRREEFDNRNRSLDDPIPPKRITWIVGDELDKFRNNPKILSSFGNLRLLTSIPTGKPSASWARTIGSALNQLWQEQERKGQYESFTRWQLLSLFRCDPWVEDILSSSNPKRAKEYWDIAIHEILKKGDSAIIGHYKEIDPLQPSRKNWQPFWLKKQRLSIEPKK